MQRPAALEDAPGDLEDLRARGRGLHDFHRRSVARAWREELRASALQGVAREAVRHRDHELLCLLLQGFEQLFLLPSEVVEARHEDVSDISEPSVAQRGRGQRDALVPMDVAGSGKRLFVLPEHRLESALPRTPNRRFELQVVGARGPEFRDQRGDATAQPAGARARSESVRRGALDGGFQQPVRDRLARLHRVGRDRAHEFGERGNRGRGHHQAAPREHEVQVPLHARGGHEKLDLRSAPRANRGFEPTQYALCLAAAGWADEQHGGCLAGGWRKACLTPRCAVLSSRTGGLVPNPAGSDRCGTIEWRASRRDRGAASCSPT